MRICKKCIMDESDKTITFDERGVCCYCDNFHSEILPNWHTDERGYSLLMKHAEKIKSDGKNRDFDCIIGLSGGIDSSYLAYIAVKKMGLKPLLFHVDAGWNSDIAVQNINGLVEGLNLDLYTEVINWEEMKDLQLAFFKSGLPSIDTPQDHAFFATMYKFAYENNIKYILTGGNYSTECVRNPIEWMYYQSDSTQLYDIHNKFGENKLISFPTTSILWHKVYLPILKNIKTIRPLDFFPYNKDQAMDLLVQKFGYQAYRQKHFESRFTRFYEGFWLLERFGFDTRKVQFSSLILTNQKKRDEALEKLKQKPLDDITIKNDKEFICSKLNISISELEKKNTAYKRKHGFSRWVDKNAWNKFGSSAFYKDITPTNIYNEINRRNNGLLKKK